MTTSSYQNQYFMSPMDQIDFSPIGEVELENTDLYKDQYTQKSFIVGIFDLKEV